MLEQIRISGLMERAREIMEAAGGKIPFSEEIEVNMTAATLWFELEKAIANSKTSEIWPNEYVTIVSDGLEPHAVLEADYKIFFTHSVYHYKINEFEPGRRFAYTAMKDHIFEGGAEVEVRPMGRKCVLKWRGEYRFEPTKSPQALVFKLYFQEKFFSELRENLHRFERQLGRA